MLIERISPDSFDELSKEFQKYIDEDITGSILCVVYHKDKIVYCNKFGWKDKKNRIPIAFDDIFRMYSMSKPITCLASLILYEQGKYELDDPIEKYLPEFKNQQVLKSYDRKTGKVVLEEARSPITIRKLLTHTSGISYGDYAGLPIDKLYGEKFGFTGKIRLRAKLDMFPEMEPLEDFSKRLASLPLAFEPGTHWWYGFNHELLGYLIERVSGKKLDVFLKEYIFDKLDMKDTDFYVPEEKWKKLPKVYTKNQKKELVEVEGAIYEGFKHKIQFLSGGGGLVSTLEDYLKFCLMMLNGGKYNNHQILSKETIKQMTSNQLPNNRTYLDMQYIPYEDLESRKFNEGYGFGLGVLVKIAANIWKTGIGNYCWAGALSTLFDIDQKNRVISIMLTQYCPETSDWIFPISRFKINNLIYDALKKTGVNIQE
jgi:CubicO group peptidase (beta-lactamase class C family)